MVGVGRHPGGGIGGAALPLDPRLPVTASHSSGVTQGGLDPVSALIIDAAPAHNLREVVEDGPGGAGHLTEVAGLLPVHGGHDELL